MSRTNLGLPAPPPPSRQRLASRCPGLQPSRRPLSTSSKAIALIQRPRATPPTKTATTSTPPLAPGARSTRVRPVATQAGTLIIMAKVMAPSTTALPFGVTRALRRRASTGPTRWTPLRTTHLKRTPTHLKRTSSAPPKPSQLLALLTGPKPGEPLLTTTAPIATAATTTSTSTTTITKPTQPPLTALYELTSRSSSRNNNNNRSLSLTISVAILMQQNLCREK